MPGLLKGVSILLLGALPCLASDTVILRNGFSIRCEHHETIGLVTRIYLSRMKTSYVDVPSDQIDHFEKDVPPPPLAPQALPSPPQTVNELISSISQQYHLDPDLVNSVIRAESGFNPRAVSPKGAQGLMQLMPQTASQLGVRETFDPAANIEGGTRYLRQLLERYNFDVVEALAAYNAGPHRVEQHHGVPPFRETHAFIARIIRDFNRKKLAQLNTAAAARANRRDPPRSMPTPSRASAHKSGDKLTANRD